MEPLFTILLILAAVCVGSWLLLPGGWARLLLWLGRKAAGLRSRTVQVDGRIWHYLIGGRGPVLVVLHGFGGDADNWLRIAPWLRRRFRLIAPDLPGFGSSDGGDGLAFDIESQAQRLVAFLDALGVKGFTLAGNSMGGWIAARVAEIHPLRVRALWLLAPLGVADCRAAELLQAIESDSEQSPLRAASPRAFERDVYRPMFAKPPPLPRPLKRFYGDRARALSERAPALFREVRSSKPPLEHTLARLQLPILLQWGNRDRAVDISGLATLCGASRQVEGVTLPEIGHLPMLEAPRPVATGFLAFAEKHGLTGDS